MQLPDLESEFTGQALERVELSEGLRLNKMCIQLLSWLRLVDFNISATIWLEWSSQRIECGFLGVGVLVCHLAGYWCGSQTALAK